MSHPTKSRWFDLKEDAVSVTSAIPLISTAFDWS